MKRTREPLVTQVAIGFWVLALIPLVWLLSSNANTPKLVDTVFTLKAVSASAALIVFGVCAWFRVWQGLAIATLCTILIGLYFLYAATIGMLDAHKVVKLREIFVMLAPLAVGIGVGKTTWLIIKNNREDQQG